MIEIIDEVADSGAQLIQFAEFCNHPTWYRDQDHCFESALDADDPFTEAIQTKAREREIFVCFNATIKGERPIVYDQNHLISPTGELLGTTQKQVLMYVEKDFYTPSPTEAKVFDTEIGRIGMYSCMDGLVPETTRVLALKGAQILLNSLASNALDEAHTHIPVRAAENKVWIVAANRSGPLVDASEMETLEQVTGIPYELLLGGGESQVIAPDGTVVVRGEPRNDGIVYATIDPDQANDKSLTRSGDSYEDRRPDAYGLLTTPNDQIPYAQTGRPLPDADVKVAVVQAGPASSLETTIDAALEGISATDAKLVALPELFPFHRDRIAADPAGAAAASIQVLVAFEKLARTEKRYIVTSLVEAVEKRHYNTTYIVGPDGVAGTYRQVHVHPDDRGWCSAGDAFAAFDLPFGTVGLMCGYDGIFPESPRILARMGADLIVYPTTWREHWEATLGVIERCSENHVSIVAAARPDSPVGEASMILALPKEYLFPNHRRGQCAAPHGGDEPPTDGFGHGGSDVVARQAPHGTDRFDHGRPARALFGAHGKPAAGARPRRELTRWRPFPLEPAT